MQPDHGRSRPGPDGLETSFVLLLVAAVGSAVVLALGAAVAGAGPVVSALAFFSVLAFGLAADRRSEAAVRWARAHRPRR